MQPTNHHNQTVKGKATSWTLPTKSKPLGNNSISANPKPPKLGESASATSKIGSKGNALHAAQPSNTSKASSAEPGRGKPGVPSAAEVRAGAETHLLANRLEMVAKKAEGLLYILAEMLGEYEVTERDKGDTIQTARLAAAVWLAYDQGEELHKTTQDAARLLWQLADQRMGGGR